MDRHCVTHAAVAQNLLAALAALAPVAHYIEGEDRTELFDRERVVAAHAVQLRDQHASAGPDLESCLLRDVGGGPSDEGRVWQPLGRNEDLRQRVALRGGQKMCAFGGEDALCLLRQR